MGQIGEPSRETPLQVPAPERNPRRETVPTPAPVKEPEKVPVPA